MEIAKRQDRQGVNAVKLEADLSQALIKNFFSAKTDFAKLLIGAALYQNYSLELVQGRFVHTGRGQH
jgi:hypothetical protein